MDSLTCPRCLGALDDPDILEPEDMRGPSYVDDNDVLVCMECRLDEGHRMAAGARDIPASEWPIREGAHDFAVTSLLDPDRKRP